MGLVGVPTAASRTRGLAMRGARSSRRVVTQAKLVLKSIGDLDTEFIMRSGLRPPVAIAEIELTRSTVLGRDAESGADTIVPVQTVSGVHAKIDVEGGAVYITDLSSTNGTYINDERIAPNRKREVLIGSSIIFGDQNLACYRLEDVPDEVEGEAEEATAEEA